MITAMLEITWRLYPAVFLMAAGLVIVLTCTRGAASMRRYGRDPMRALALLRGFRRGMIGVCLATFGAAWLWQIDWLLILSALIFGEELLESTVAIAALRHDPAIGATSPAPGTGLGRCRTRKA